MLKQGRWLGATLVAALAVGVAGGVGGAALWDAVDDEIAQPAPEGSASRPAADQSGLSIGEIYRRASPGVVQIRREGGNPGGFGFSQPGATGSGFVIDDQGRIVTNQHVVENAEQVTVVFPNGDEEEAQVVGTDRSTDIALLDLEGDRDVTPLQLGSSDALKIGDPVVAIGSPFGLQGTLTAGIVSALERRLRAPDGFSIEGAIQTDAALNSGNSGGPLLDAEGRVVGVNSQIESGNGGNVGIGYAVSIKTAKEVVDELLADGEVEHAYLGVRIAEEENGKIVLADVVAGSPAARAGMRSGDVVVEVGGNEVDDVNDVGTAVAERRPGEELSLTVERGGERETYSAKLTGRPLSAQ